MMSSVSLIDGHIDDDVSTWTDNEIIEHLKNCINKQHPVFYHIKKDGLKSVPITIKDIERVISNQKVEIARQNDLINRQSDVISEQKEKIERMYAEAIEEFAERFLEILERYSMTFIEVQDWRARNTILQIKHELNNLVKEMVGGNNE